MGTSILRMPAQTQSAYTSGMVKKIKLHDVEYELLQRVGDHVQLQIKVHAKTQVFWLNTKTEKKVVRVGRGFKPGRGGVPGQAQWVKLVPPAPKPAPAKTPVALPAVASISKLEEVVRERYQAEFSNGSDPQIVAFFLLGEKLGLSLDFLAGLALAEGVVTPVLARLKEQEPAGSEDATPSPSVHP